MSLRSTVWGLPLTALTRQGAVDRVDQLVRDRVPSYFITANVHYAMLTSEVPELDAINQNAAFILADGAPLVVASRRTDNPVPERVAGSDLIYDLCRLASDRDYGIFLLGGPPGIAEEAACKLMARYPGLRIVGTACPEPDELHDPRVDGLIASIRATKPDLLFVALGQPKGEFWLSRHLDSLEVPVVAQVGATLEFVAGRVRRAPRILQKLALEWAFRIYTDPRRLGPRYWKNARFLGRQILRDRTKRCRLSVSPDEPVSSVEVSVSASDGAGVAQ